jgi:Sulfotransferase family
MHAKPFSTLNPASAEAPATSPALPNFFIVGAPKAGTTSLYHYLAQHPDVYMSPIKEPNYFSEEIRLGNIDANWQEWAQREDASLQQYLRGPMQEKRFGGIVSNWPDYLKLFQNVNGEKALGEASVCYLWSKTAAQNIASTLPNSKIIMVLRDPVERAFSQYKQSVASGLVKNSFRELVETNLNRKSDKFDLLNPFLEFGLYHEQVKRYMELFPAENLRIYLYEELRRALAETLADIFRFLGVDPQFSPDTSEQHLRSQVPRYIWPSYMLNTFRMLSPLKNAIPGPFRPAVRKWVFSHGQSLELDPADRIYLNNYYREDTVRLSTLIKRDLHGWLH